MSVESVELLNFISQTLNNDPTKDDIFNWREISKLPLTPEFIDQHNRSIAWDVACQHQSLDLETVTKYEVYMNYDLMAKNPNLKKEVLLARLDKMDWDTLQTYQKFDDASTYFVHIPCGNVGEEYHLILEPIIPRKRRK